MIVVKKQIKGDIPGSIQNCDRYLTSVKDNLPTSKEIPEGAREIKLELGHFMADDARLFMNYDWRLKGGLACQETSCPKPLTLKSVNSGSDLSSQVLHTKNLHFKHAWVIMFIGGIMERINKSNFPSC